PTATNLPASMASPSAGSAQDKPTFLLVLFAVVGGTAFAYEIAWTRLLAITIGSSTYAFTLMLAAFLAGTVIGSAFFQHFFARARQVSLTTFSRTQTWAGVVALSSLVLFPYIAYLIPLLLRATHQTFGGLVLAQVVTSTLTVLPIALVFGFNFPAVVVLLGHNAGNKSAESAWVGRAYAANTLGAIIGSLMTGFWLVSWLGNCFSQLCWNCTPPGAASFLLRQISPASWLSFSSERLPFSPASRLCRFPRCSMGILTTGISH